MTTRLPYRQALLRSLRPISVSDMSDSSTGNDTCTICLGDLADNAKAGKSERAVLLHGKHFFGEECIRRWLEENNSCPSCRKKVLAGSDEHERRRIARLTAEFNAFLQHVPDAEFPIYDSEVFNWFGRLSSAMLRVSSDFLCDELKRGMTDLLAWRADWWHRDPESLAMLEFAPYTRTEGLRAEDFNTPIVVNEDQVVPLLLHSIDTGYIQGLSDYAEGNPLHVGSHPLSFQLYKVIRRRLRKDQGKSMIVSTLAVRLRDALQRCRQTRGLMRGEREDLPRGYQAFAEDVIVCIVQGLIRPQ